ncbi:hypothetical protein C8R43DRAFT_959864 [Mycena crocata]|nr:hypothetical protein C8R43DRAFT_959864 [Mycena crocata]
MGPVIKATLRAGKHGLHGQELARADVLCIHIFNVANVPDIFHLTPLERLTLLGVANNRPVRLLPYSNRINCVATLQFISSLFSPNLATGWSIFGGANPKPVAHRNKWMAALYLIQIESVEGRVYLERGKHQLRPLFLRFDLNKLDGHTIVYANSLWTGESILGVLAGQPNSLQICSYLAWWNHQPKLHCNVELIDISRVFVHPLTWTGTTRKYWYDGGGTDER